MPNSTLPPDNYLGDPERTTGEFQDQINNLQNWVNTLQAELDALSGTTLQEGAVRDVGTSANNLVETSRLDTRLGTSGNLDTAAQQKADQNLRTTDTVQFGRITDAASPGDGDFDSNKLGYWDQTVALDLDLSGNSVKCVRIGDLVVITFTATPSYTSTSDASSNSGVIPSAFRPSDEVRITSEIDASAQRMFILRVNEFGLISIRSYRVNFSSEQIESSAGTIGVIPTISYTV